MAEDKTGLYLVTIVSIAVIVGLVTLYLNSGMAISLGDANLVGQATAIEYGWDDLSISQDYKMDELSIYKDELSISKDISIYKDELAISKRLYSGDNLNLVGVVTPTD